MNRGWVVGVLGVVVGCGGYGASGASGSRAPRAATASDESKAIEGLRDQCIAGNCEPLATRCIAAYQQKTPVTTSHCTLAGLKVSAASVRSAIAYLGKVAPYDQSSESSLSSLGYRASPDEKRAIGEALCGAPAPAWATNDDVLDGDREDHARHVASACHLLGEYYAKGTAMDLPKALAAEKDGCKAAREADATDECAFLNLLVEHTIAKDVPDLAIPELRARCDAAKPGVHDGSAHACTLLSELVATRATTDASANDAVAIGQKACTTDRMECERLISPYVKLQKSSPAAATRLAEWIITQKTPTDARGSNVYLHELQMGASKDPAKANATARELCESPARGVASACFVVAAAASPAEKPALDERAKARMKADMDAMTGEITERIKATQATRDAHQKERQAKRDAAMKAKYPPAAPRPARATASNHTGASDDDDAEESSATSAAPATGRKQPRKQTTSGFGHGPSRDLTCASAKLSAVSRAGCSGLPRSAQGDCSCSEMFKQWTCNVTMTVTCD